MKNTIVASLVLIVLPAAAGAQSSVGNAVPVTVANFARAESGHYLATNAKEAGLGKLSHRREPASIDNQTVIRLNRDTLYSFGVFDLAAGPVTVTLPDAGKRFMSLQIINEDHYVPFVAYDHKPHMLTEKNVGTRYVMVAIRTLVNPNDQKDLDEVHKLQDAIKAEQKEAGKLELPNWDQAGLREIRDALLLLAKHTDSFSHAFGAKGQVDPIKHLIGTAAGWGGNPDKDATYISGVVPKNDGKTVYKLRVQDVPVNAFWSVSVYNAAGYFEKNPYNPIRSITSRRRKTRMALSRCSSAAATAKFQIVCPSCPVGITQYGSIDRALKSSMANGNFPIRSQQADGLIYSMYLRTSLTESTKSGHQDPFFKSEVPRQRS